MFGHIDLYLLAQAVRWAVLDNPKRLDFYVGDPVEFEESDWLLNFDVGEPCDCVACWVRGQPELPHRRFDAWEGPADEHAWQEGL